MTTKAKTRVPDLSSLVSPAHVPPDVRTVVIFPIEAHPARLWSDQVTDITQENRRAMPGLPHVDPPGAIPAVVMPVLVVTPVHHVAPGLVQWVRFREAVRPDTRLHSFERGLLGRRPDPRCHRKPVERFLPVTCLPGCLDSQAAARARRPSRVKELGQRHLVNRAAIALKAGTSLGFPRPVRDSHFCQDHATTETIARADGKATITHRFSPVSIRTGTQEPSGALTPGGSAFAPIILGSSSSSFSSEDA